MAITVNPVGFYRSIQPEPYLSFLILMVSFYQTQNLFLITLHTVRLTLVEQKMH